MKTYHDIREITGLSLSTISKYFTGGNLRENNRRAIEKAVHQLEYRVNDHARALRSRRSRTVGLLLPQFGGAFCSSIMDAAGRELMKNGYSSIACSYSWTSGGEAEGLKFLLDRMVDGAIVFPGESDGAYLSAADDAGAPVVLVDRLTGGARRDSVVIDNAAAGFEAGQLICGAGHRRVAALCGARGCYTVEGRLRGFYDALSRCGIAADSAPAIACDFDIPSAIRAAETLLARRDRPTAVFCTGYEMTVGFLSAINARALRIPGDISIVGFDDILISEIVRPRLAMIRQPMDDIGVSAARLILRRLEGDINAPPREIVLRATLEAGASVKMCD